MSIKGIFVQVGGYREVANEVEVPADLEKSGIVARACQRVKEKSMPANFFWGCRCPPR
jgi:hypothetical protein